jgi:mannose-1-phosphate guanylyltransferase
MLHAVIMAGGAGTRFWPESREARPKQLLRMVGDRTMLRATVDRLDGLVPPDRIVVATTAALAGAIAAELPELPSEAILAEPCKRNTAPCIGLAALRILRDDPDAAMLVMPSDHVIEDEEAFRGAVQLAESLVDADPQRLVTFGIRPTYPAEIFGYIERGDPLPPLPINLRSVPGEGRGEGAQPLVFNVLRFHEKPDAQTAQRYLEGGTHYWNSGIFLWKARTIEDALARHEPEMHGHLQRIAAAHGSRDYDEVLQREFSAIRGLSIDYAVMERSGSVIVVEAPFPWDDVGSWQALARLRGTDAEGNTVVAKHLGLDTKGTIVRGADGHLIVTVGLEDCLVVHTPDATLVADKHCEESIRRVVEMLRQRGWTEYL